MKKTYQLLISLLTIAAFLFCFAAQVERLQCGFSEIKLLGHGYVEGYLRPLAAGEHRADDIVGIIDIDGMQIDVTRQAWEDLQAFASTEFNKCTKDITSSCKLKNKTMHDETVMVEVVIRHPAIKTSCIKLLLDPLRDHKLVDAKLIESGERYQIENDIKELPVDDTTRQISISSDEYTYTVITLSTVPEARILRVEQEKIFLFENSAHGVVGLYPGGSRGRWMGTIYPDPERTFKIALSGEKLKNFRSEFLYLQDEVCPGRDAYVAMEGRRVFLILKNRDSGVTLKLPYGYIWNKLSELLSDAAVMELFGHEYLGKRDKISDESIMDFLKKGKKIEIIRRRYWEGYVTPNTTKISPAFGFMEHYRRQLQRLTENFERTKIIDLHIHPAQEGHDGILNLVNDLANSQDKANRAFAVRNIADRDSWPSPDDIQYWGDNCNWDQPGLPWQALTGIIYHQIDPEKDPYVHLYDSDASIMLYMIPPDFQRRAEWLGYRIALDNFVEHSDISTDEANEEAQELLIAFMDMTARYQVRIQPVRTEQIKLKIKLPKPELRGLNGLKEVLSSVLRPVAAWERRKKGE